MGERDTRNEKVIEEFVLVINESGTSFAEKDVRVKAVIDKSGKTIQEVFNQDGKKIGTIHKDNSFEYDSQYKEDLKHSMGEYAFKILKLDSKNIKVDVNRTKEKQEELEAQQRLNVLNNNINKNEENNKEDLNNENNKKQNDMKKTENIIANNNQPEEKEKKEKEFKKEDLLKYERVNIKDENYAKDLIDTNKYDYQEVYVVLDENKMPKIYAKQNNNTGVYDEIKPYTLQHSVGEIDTIEHGKEDETGKGYELTIKNKNNKYIKMDVSRNGSEIVLKDTSEDLDNDKTTEATRIETEYYRGKNNAERELERYRKSGMYDVTENVLENEEKKEIGIDTDEINEGSLTDSQLKEELDKSDLSEEARAEVIKEIEEFFNNYKKNPTIEELQNMIENNKEKEIEEPEEEQEEEWEFGRRRPRPH